MSHLEDDDLLKTQTPGAAGLIAGRYKVIRQLGRGGMGEVFLVQDAVSGVQFALKRIPEDLVRSSAEMEDIRETYSLVCNLSHPHIANYKHLERDPESGSYYLIMEYVDGLSLDRWIKKNGPMTESQALKMLSGLASALDFAHSHRVIHRDVKASNIIVYGDCEAKLIDFGLAAQIKSSLTRRSMLDPGENVKGTRPYMAPELWRGKKAMESADQWALAATIYEAVTGDPPWLSDDMAILGACITNDEPDRPEGISDALWSALERGLAKDPKARWTNCIELAQVASGYVKVQSASAAGEKKEKEEIAHRQAELEEQIRQEQEKRIAAEAEAAAEKKRREAERARAEAAERRRQQEDAQQGASLEIDADKGRKKRSWPVVVSVAAVATVILISAAIWWFSVGLPRPEERVEDSRQVASEDRLVVAQIQGGLSPEGHPWLGASDPRIEIQEFTDYECPFCAKAHMRVRQMISSMPGVRLYHRHLPLDNSCNPSIVEPFHTRACEFSRASICAQDQGRFWEMNDLLFQGSEEIRRKKTPIADLAVQVGLDLDRFASCMLEPSQFFVMKADIEDGERLGLKGTPAYLVQGSVYYGEIKPEVLFEKKR